MSAPRGPYAAWVSWLDAFSIGEDLPASHLTALDDVMGPEMQQRVYDRVQVAFHARLEFWMRQFDRDRSHAGTPEALARVLAEARRRLSPLARLTRMEQFDNDARIKLAQALTQSVTTMQDSLTRSARQDPRVERQLLGVISSVTLLDGLTASATQVGPGLPAASSTVLRPVRRVIG